MTDARTFGIPELTAVIDGADHVDVKTVTASLSLREFVAATLRFRPRWLVGLFAIRAAFAWLLRLRHPVPTRVDRRPTAERISFAPGAAAGFFTVTAGQEDTFLLMHASDTHLTGYLAFVVDPADLTSAAPGSGANARRTFHAVTVVRYHRWTGPVYFAVVRPFHHLVVGAMVRSAARTGRSPGVPGGSGDVSRQAQNRNNPAPTAAR
jgi:hypothetical protein